jgi:predicted transposase YdaD
MDHDHLFKELITTCFREFVSLFMPALYREMDPDSITFEDKEIFTDIARGEKHEADIVVKARLKDTEAFFLIHVENQAKAQPAFAERMFRYFARLYEKYNLPVYPVAVLSWDRPKREQSNRFVVKLSDFVVNEFQYHAIQLNRLDWRDYLHSDNPVAAALMAKMNVAPKDRPRVKLECLKTIAMKRLDPAKTRLLLYIVDSYLPLRGGQQEEFEERLEEAGMVEKEAVMDMTTSWERRGMEKGLAKGLEEGRRKGRELGLEQGRQEGRQALAEVVLAFLHRQVGALPEEQAHRVSDLPMEGLENLSKALLDFHTSDDLDAWLMRG